MPLSWFSPFPDVERGKEGRETLKALDDKIGRVQAMAASLEKHRKRLESDSNFDDDLDLCERYLKVVEKQRRADNELELLQNERIKEVIRANLAYDTKERGENFPYPTLEAHATEFIQVQRRQLEVLSAVSFFGMSVTFSTILSATRGSIGLMSLSWAAFSLSFSVCVYAAFLRPHSPVYSIVAYPQSRKWWYTFVMLATVAAFVGIVLMGMTLAILDLKRGDEANKVDTRLNTFFGGWLSLLPIVIAFFHGIGKLLLRAWSFLKMSKNQQGEEGTSDEKLES